MYSIIPFGGKYICDIYISCFDKNMKSEIELNEGKKSPEIFSYFSVGLFEFGSYFQFI